MTKEVEDKTKKNLRAEHDEECGQESSCGAVTADVEVVRVEVDGEGNDDEDSPVGISWKDSKEVFKQDEKKRKEAVDFVRSKRKEKRRKKNEMFVSQKRCRTNELLTKLPDDIVHAVAKKLKVDTNNQRTEKEFVGEVKEKQKSPTKCKKKGKSRDGPKKHGHYKVLVVEDEVKKPKKVQDSAATFLENHLYGNRLHRTSHSSNLTSRCKSSGKMKPAVKFCNKV